MVIDLTPLAASLDQFAVTLNQFAEFSIRWVLPTLNGLFLIGVYFFGRHVQKTADRIGVTLDALIGAWLLLRSSGDLTPEEVMSRVRTAWRDA